MTEPHSTGREDQNAPEPRSRQTQEDFVKMKGDPATNLLQGAFGRYRIVRKLGAGAMGAVYSAHDTLLERDVALKTPSFGGNPDPELIKRFYREARAAANLRHANICQVHDVGELNGLHFITMEYIEGRTLASFIRPEKLLPQRTAAILVRKLAMALAHAHERGVIHRDLKPANIIVDERSEPIVMDFGLARRADASDESRMTQSGMILGTPAYMSPEQVEGDPDQIGPSTDQYSLGVILYELLTAELPFRGSIASVIGQIMTQQPRQPGEYRDDLDPRLESLCLRMMAKQPSERFSSMTEAADALTSFLKKPDQQMASRVGAESTQPVAEDRTETDEVTDDNLEAFLKERSEPNVASRLQRDSKSVPAKAPSQASHQPTRSRSQRHQKVIRDTAPVSLMAPWQRMPTSWRWSVIGAGLVACLVLLGFVWFPPAKTTPANTTPAEDSTAGPVPIAEPITDTSPVRDIRRSAQINNRAEPDTAHDDVMSLLVYDAAQNRLPVDAGWTHDDSEAAVSAIDHSGGVLTLDSTMTGRSFWTAELRTERMPSEAGLFMETTTHLEREAHRRSNRGINLAEIYEVTTDLAQGVALYAQQQRIFIHDTNDKEVISMPIDTTDGYHTYRIELRDTIVRLYVDGVLRRTSQSPWLPLPADYSRSREVLHAKFGDGSGFSSSRAHFKRIVFGSLARSALLFDGVDDYVDIPNLTYDGSSPWTVEVWARPLTLDENSSRTPTLIGDWGRSAAGQGLVLLPTGRWNFGLCQTRPGNHMACVSATPARLSERVHLAGVIDGRLVRLYVNGRHAATGALINEYLPSVRSFLLGASWAERDGQENFFHGELEQIRVSTTARYEDDFVAPRIFSADRHTAALYLVQQSGGSILTDMSRYQRDGRIHGATWTWVDSSLRVASDSLP